MKKIEIDIGVSMIVAAVNTTRGKESFAKIPVLFIREEIKTSFRVFTDF